MRCEKKGEGRDHALTLFVLLACCVAGEYLHLSNPDDPAKPIIGHIFKVFVPKGSVCLSSSRSFRRVADFRPLSCSTFDSCRSDKVGLSVCWYFRPEQTIHPADRTFYEHEVFKTGEFASKNDASQKVGENKGADFRSLCCRSSIRRSRSGGYHREDRMPVLHQGDPRTTQAAWMVPWLAALFVLFSSFSCSPLPVLALN